MRKIFLLILLFLVVFSGCEKIIDYNVDFLKEFEAALAEYKKQKEQGVSITTSIPNADYTSNNISYYNKSVAIAFTTTGEKVSTVTKINGAVVSGIPVNVSTEGLNYLILKAYDNLGKTAYFAKKIFIDTTKPVVKFVNTTDSIRLDKINDFVDSVPDNAMEDDGSGINLATRRGAWKGGTPTATGIFVRQYFIKDNVGNESLPCELNVTVLPPAVYPQGMAITGVPTADVQYKKIQLGVSFTNTPSDGSVVWSVDNTDFATVGSDSGELVAVAVGSVIVTAKSVMDDTIVATATLNISQRAVDQIYRDSKFLDLIYKEDFNGTTTPTGLNFTGPMTFATEGFATFQGDAADVNIIFNANVGGKKFDYIEISTKWNNSSFGPNFYVNNQASGAYGFTFCKTSRTPKTYFMDSNWSPASAGYGRDITLKTNGEDNKIGFLETETGGVIYFNGTESTHAFARAKYTYGSGTDNIRFGFNSDTKVTGLTVYVDYIRFYSIAN